MLLWATANTLRHLHLIMTPLKSMIRHFNELYENICSTISKISAELRKGNAGALPLRYGKNDPCSYCKMRPICRKDDI